jgi:uncharacterized protein (DUF2062 family)
MCALENPARGRHASVVHRHFVRLLLWVPDVLRVALLQGTGWFARVGWLIAILLLGQHCHVELHAHHLVPAAGGCLHRPGFAPAKKFMRHAIATTPPHPPSRLKKFWRERVVALVAAQLVQGFTPQKIALTIALGLNLGIFPILGATTTLCAVAGLWLKLNQPVIQLVNWLASPLQLVMILVFVRLGEWLVHAPHISFSIPELFQKFHQSPLKFLREFG